MAAIGNGLSMLSAMGEIQRLMGEGDRELKEHFKALGEQSHDAMIRAKKEAAQLKKEAAEHGYYVKTVEGVMPPIIGQPIGTLLTMGKDDRAALVSTAAGIGLIATGGLATVPLGIALLVAGPEGVKDFEQGTLDAAKENERLAPFANALDKADSKEQMKKEALATSTEIAAEELGEEKTRAKETADEAKSRLGEGRETVRSVLSDLRATTRSILE